MTSLLLSPVSRAHSRPGTDVSRGEPPRYFLMLLLDGGMDALLTTDPKTRADLTRGVDLPYAAADIVEAGRLPLGPLLAPLAPWASHLSVVNGVQVHTANHPTGKKQYHRMRTVFQDTTPSLMDIVGAHRDGQPLGSVAFGIDTRNYSGRLFAGREIFEVLDSLTPDELDATTHVLEAQTEPLQLSLDTRAQASVGALHEVSALIERWPRVPHFTPEPWAATPAVVELSRDLQRTLWLLRNDLVRGVFVRCRSAPSAQFRGWDSHYSNTDHQRFSTSNFLSAFLPFLEALRASGLLSKTLIVAGSELGRFPYLNKMGGKDHFPEIPLLFLGGGIHTAARGAVFGQTGKEMEALPISLETGRADATGTRIELEDVGTTLLTLLGISPRSYGYFGRRLRFLEGLA